MSSHLVKAAFQLGTEAQHWFLGYSRFWGCHIQGRDKNGVSFSLLGSIEYPVVLDTAELGAVGPKVLLQHPRMALCTVD